MSGAPVIEASHIHKRFGHVTALADAGLAAREGEVMALLGDNGAGKSTLIKILSGVIQPDEGEIRYRGGPVRWSGPADVQEAGIETVYQDFSLAPDLDVVENLFLGREIKRSGVLGWLGILNRRAMRSKAREDFERIGVRVQSLSQPIETLSGGQRQAVAIARAAIWGTDVLIMDEPTAALGVRESEIVSRLIEHAKAEGLTVVLITHDIPRALELADRLTVLRRGRTVGELERGEATLQDVIHLMSGLTVEGGSGGERR